MASVVWPGGLPQMPLFEGYREVLRSQVIESRMDVGPAKVRRRTAVDLRDITAVYKMTDAQRTTFVGFVKDTVMGGAVLMDWPHPILGTKEARLKTNDGQNLGEKVAPNAWFVTVELEVTI